MKRGANEKRARTKAELLRINVSLFVTRSLAHYSSLSATFRPALAVAPGAKSTHLGRVISGDEKHGEI